MEAIIITSRLIQKY